MSHSLFICHFTFLCLICDVSISKMSQENSGGLLVDFSNLLGTSEAALRLLLTVLAGYPLAFIYRHFIYGKPQNSQHLFNILTGFLLGYFNYGLDFLLVVSSILFSYIVLFLLGGTALSVAAIFICNLTYLLAGYYYVGTDNYDINWTMPQCILVLRLIGIAYDLYDGQQPLETLSSENKKVALTKCPTILEFFGHTLFPASFLIGPQFPMKRYQSFTAGEFSEKDCAPDSLKAGLLRFGLGTFYLLVFQILGFYVSDDYLLSEEFANLGFLRRVLLMGIWGRFNLYKYISCWLLTEGVCILYGLSYNGKDENGTIQWNGLENVKLSIFENTTEFNHYIMSFNINTNKWVAQYIYKRLKFLGNRNLSQLGVLLFLAIWHGLHSGYYVCFFFEFIVVYMERDIKSIVKSNEKLSEFFATPKVELTVKFLLRVYTFVFMGWCLMPFVLLRFDKYWQAFGAVNHCGTLLFGLWPFVYSPLLRKILKKSNKVHEN